VTTAGPAMDALSLTVYWNRLVAICEEGQVCSIRTSFSTIIRESSDVGTIICDVDGNLLAEAKRGTSAAMSCAARAMKLLLREFPHARWAPGDVVFTNDPWLAAGHRYDFVLAAPVFLNGALVAFAVSVSHAQDVGGPQWTADCRTVFEEGMGFPPMKLFNAGEVNADVLAILRVNSRVPEIVIGDWYAQVAGLEVVKERLAEFMQEYGFTSLATLSQRLIGLAEQAMRKAISHIPAGTYCGETFLDGYGEPLRLAAAVTVNADELVIDFAGTAMQVAEAGINCPMSYTWAYTTFALKCLLDPDSPRNEGSFRPIRIVAQEGSLVNATWPAAVNARTLVGDCMPSLLFAALERALPGNVIAESGSSPPHRHQFEGIGHDGQPFVFTLFVNGGMGARPTADGLHGTGFPTPVGCTPFEVMEARAPLIAWKRELTPDSGGPGTFRGGCGQTVVIEVSASRPINWSVISDKWDFPPQGRAGGLPGKPNRVERTRGEGPAPRRNRTILMPGDRIELTFAGGGGFGPAANRKREEVLRDVRDGIVSTETARDVYQLETPREQGL